MDSKHLVNLQGRLHPLYGGVLAEAHERGLQSITVDLIQIPTAENDWTAICRATVVMKDGAVFSDLGDASPKNTNSRIATALIRMASTRSKGRALRDAVNIGEALAEELPDLEETHAPLTPRDPNPRAKEAVQAAERAPATAQVTPPKNGDGVCEECGAHLTPGQVEVSRRNYRRLLCPAHQKAAMEAARGKQG